jgi:hydroxymethylpyrimidine/phosphomethylpyrimidine kinase
MMMAGTSAIPNVLTIAGVDPSGGAGVLADVKAMSALSAYACAVVAALTAQNTQGVAGIHPVPADFIALQIDTLCADVRIDAAKIGMVGGAAAITAVAGRLERWLLPLATVVTPNLPEAGVLLEARAPETLREMYRAAERLRERMAHDGERWVLLKGGHLPGGDVTDLLFDGDRMIELAARRVDTKNTHGTGCTLSAALAALLPQSPDVPSAARRAKEYLTGALRAAGKLDVGKGHGPVHHFYALWGARPV